MARGINCSPSQIIVTGGYSAGLGLALRVLGLEGQKAWMEEPGFPFTRRSEEHTSELQSLMRISYAVFCLKKKKNNITTYDSNTSHLQTQQTHLISDETH